MDGMQIETSRPMDKGQSVRLELLTDKAFSRFTVNGTVRWCKPEGTDPESYSVGLKFEDLGTGARTLLTELIDIIERRREQRFRVSTRLAGFQKSEDPEHAADQINARGLDLSLTGIRMEADRQLESGQQLHLEFRLKSGHRITGTDVKIQWCEPKDDGTYLVGAKFVDLDPEARAFIDKAIRAGGSMVVFS